MFSVVVLFRKMCLPPWWLTLLLLTLSTILGAIGVCFFAFQIQKVKINSESAAEMIPHEIIESAKVTTYELLPVKARESTVAANEQLKNNGKVPEDIAFGASTAAYQVEGAWNVDGKGESIWDNYTHRVPSPITNGDTGDVACNSYYRYKEDVQLAAALGIKLYRFSISWPRILPTGYSDQINQKGIDYYQNLVREIREYGMTPAVTIYHWDLPQRLYEDGIDWTNTSLIPHFVNYARIVIKSLPEVGIWSVINEPRQICHFGYGSGLLAPGIKRGGVLDYQCAYVVLKAHAAVYHMYKNEFPDYSAKMSAVIVDAQWIQPLTNSTEDEEAADRQRQFEYGMYLHPVFNGDWPEVVKKRISERSKAANLPKSRLPQFTEDEIEYIKGTHDFLGFNHYYTTLASDVPEAPPNEISYNADLRVVNSLDPSWKVQANGIFATVPFGVRNVLNWLVQQYGRQSILITEIGMSENGTNLNDTDRINFYNDYFCYVLEAVHEGVDVIGIIFWSLLDSFEWSSGFSSHFGLYHIDFKDPNLTRTPKRSAEFVQKLTKTRKLSCDKLRRNWPGPI